MIDRTVLAAVLGVGLGLVLLVAPGAVITVHTAGRLPQDRSGEYGSGSAGSPRLKQLVRVVGAGFVLAGCYFGWQALAV